MSGTVTQVSSSCQFCQGSPLDNNAIGCDTCESWYHGSTLCTGLKEETIGAILGEDAASIRFVCSKCRCSSPSTSSSPQGASELSAGLSQLFRTVQCLASTVSDLSRQVSTFIQNPRPPTPLPPRPNEPTTDTQSYMKKTELYGEIREIEERRKRINSVIVRGIDAPSEAVFLEKFHRVSQSIIQASPTASNIFFIDRDKKICRIDINDRQARTALLSNAKNLKEGEFRDIYISKDLTYTQRRENARKRAENRSNSNNRNPGEPSDNNGAGNTPLTNANSEPLGQASIQPDGRDLSASPGANAPADGQNF